MQGSERSGGDRVLGVSSLEAHADWGAGYSAPEPQDPDSPPTARPSGPGLREQHSAAHWRPEALTPTLPLTPAGAYPRQMCT